MPPIPTGLGTQLRHLIELLDDRPRYTPLMRAPADGATLTIG